MLAAANMARASDDDRVTVWSAATRGGADECALVLSAEGLHPRVVRGGGSFRVDVPEVESVHATTALDAYRRENPPVVPVKVETPPFDLVTGLAISCALIAFFGVTGPRDSTVPWFAVGSADAAGILAGEFWRTVTALTLHADLGHVLGNALAGTLFIGAVCGSLGAGLGAALVLVSGAAGNLANAVLSGAPHSSVGASTAIFGALGILATQGVSRHHALGTRGRRLMVPLAAGAALLAMLGTGQRADVSAHLLGLAAGALLGIAVARPLTKPPNALLQGLLLTAGVALIWACWSTALG